MNLNALNQVSLFEVIMVVKEHKSLVVLIESQNRVQSLTFFGMIYILAPSGMIC